MAVQFDPALMLFHNTVNRRQSQTRAFADLFSSKERLKNARKIFRRNARPGIADADANKAALPRVRMAGHILVIQVRHRNANGQVARP